MEAQLQYVMEYQQQAVQYQGELAAALMGALTQCANHLHITEPLPVLPSFQPPHQPAPQQQQAEAEQDEDDEEEEDETEGSETSSTESEDEEDEDMDGGDG